MNITKLLCIIAMSVSGVAMSAQNEKPVFKTYEWEDQSMIQSMSDNGMYAVASGGENADVRLINIDKGIVTVISSDMKTESGKDITNNGLIVVGSNASKPSYYSKLGMSWKNVEVTAAYPYGTIYSVTPDGKYGAGVIYKSNGYDSKAALWNLTTGKLIETPGLPTKDMSHKDQGQMSFYKISADGKRILGCMSFSYLPTSLDLGGCFYFVYDVDAQSYKTVGFTETAIGRWTPHTDGMICVMDAYMSNNGRYVTGKAHISNDIEGADYADEYSIPFLFDVDNNKFTGYNESTVKDTYGSAVTNDGVVIDVTPEGTPVREWSLRSGKYWFAFTEILKQKYSSDIKTATGFTNTGTIHSISDDGKRIAAFPDPYSSYVADLPVGIESLGDGIKLLGSYYATPDEGSEVSHLKNVTVTFGRNIKALGERTSAQILGEDGETIFSSVGFEADGKNLNIRFRTGTMEEGKRYQLFIPEGTICMEEDTKQTNSNIYIMYSGRKDEAVSVTNIYPANGAVFSHIDYSTSPVIITFNTNIQIADDASAVMYRNDEPQPFCSLTLAQSANQLALYPATLQYLYDGSTYRIVVKAGAVTDVAGNNPCEEISISYTGNYVREISADDIILFSDDFDNGLSNFMQWCGDQNSPTEEMINWDFEKGMAWGLVRDDEASGDRMATSHSMYSPAGQSDDWLVTPQIYIPDMLCSVKFLSQSYKEDKEDILKVIVWESNNVYSTLSQEVIDQMKAEGKVVYNKRQSPGKTEEVLGGEWTYNTINLADFAGKNIYIAFVNQNKAQSAIFMDSLEVRHDMNYLTSLIYEESVVNKESAAIKGTVIGNNEAKAYDKLTLTLKDAEGNTVDTYTASGINLKKGDKHQFVFATPLPLTLGIENAFSVLADLDGEQNEIKASVKNLAFQPVKRIVLEEYTGRACGNCPLGVLGMEKLEERYGESFIPISIHTYNNDPLSSGLSSYTSSLGIDGLGAPSGIINRGTGCYPAVSATVNDIPRYFFTNTETPTEEDKLWADYAAEEMETPAESGIDITNLTYNQTTGSLEADCEIKYALNASNQSVNLFTVLLEDNLSQKQSNYMASISSPDLGEWGLGGKYGQSTVTDYLHQDVCRNVNGLTINGTGGYIPSTVVAGEVYKAQVSVAVPANVQNINECKVVVMMINANTGRVINAARMKYNSDPTSIETPNYQLSIINYQLDRTYNLAGQLVDGSYKGIVIRGGKKYIQR